MSEDLSAFFAKKKDKKKKGAGAVKVDDIGQTLERRVKKQEEQEVSASEDDKRLAGDEERRAGGGVSEESEWIEYGDSNTGRLEGLKIKDMGAESEQPEEETHESEEQKEQHETKTWGQVEKEKDNDIETAADMAAYQTSQTQRKFVPSVLQRSRPAEIDVSNQEMFPSLADASKMETAKKEDAKTGGGGWLKTGQSENRPVPMGGRAWGSAAPVSAGKDRENALASLREMHASNTSSPAPRPAAPPVEEPALKKPTAGSGAYVPPHLRNKLRENN